MSGIAALFQRDGDPADGAVLSAMLERLRHRGPDGAGRHVAGDVALGHCLLATTPEDVAQPLASPAADRWIVADARLDNRDELIRAWGGPAEGCDAALILWAYERWGDDCPLHLCRRLRLRPLGQPCFASRLRPRPARRAPAVLPRGRRLLLGAGPRWRPSSPTRASREERRRRRSRSSSRPGTSSATPRSGRGVSAIPPRARPLR